MMLNYSGLSFLVYKTYKAEFSACGPVNLWGRNQTMKNSADQRADEWSRKYSFKKQANLCPLNSTYMNKI